MSNHISSNFKAIHKAKNSLHYRGGRERLRVLSLKQLNEKLESAQSGTLRDKIRKEIARKEKLGLVWHKPVEQTADE